MAGFLIFARLLGFFRFAPIFCRKELPSLVKLAIALLITVMIIPLFDPKIVLEKVEIHGFGNAENQVTVEG